METKKKTGLFIGIAVVLVIILATIFLGRNSSDTSSTADTTTSTPTDTTTPDTTTVPPVDTPKNTASVYKDGTYSATGSYISPGGPDQIAITLTLKDDIITDISATPEPGDNTSANYQAKFMSGYKALVVGKNIADVNLTKVSGSSLTPKGFNDAIAQIKAQAKA